MKRFFIHNQQKIALGIGYVLVFLLAFGLGKITTSIPNPPEIVIEEPKINIQANSTPEEQGIQGVVTEANSAPAQSASFAPTDGQCGGKIKGNVGSSENIYHMPGGSFYDRTDAELCFTTEAAAVSAGFRKSSR